MLRKEVYRPHCVLCTTTIATAYFLLLLTTACHLLPPTCYFLQTTAMSKDRTKSRCHLTASCTPFTRFVTVPCSADWSSVDYCKAWSACDDPQVMELACRNCREQEELDRYPRRHKWGLGALPELLSQAWREAYQERHGSSTGSTLAAVWYQELDVDPRKPLPLWMRWSF